MYSIGDGLHTRFWCDPWVNNDLYLADKSIVPLDLECSTQCISDFTIAPWIWNSDLLRSFLPNDIILRISAISPLQSLMLMTV